MRADVNLSVKTVCKSKWCVQLRYRENLLVHWRVSLLCLLFYLGFVPLCDVTTLGLSKHPRNKQCWCRTSSKRAGRLNALPPPFLKLRQASALLTKGPVSASLVAVYIFISPPRESHVEETGLERETSLRWEKKSGLQSILSAEATKFFIPARLIRCAGLKVRSLPARIGT